MHIDIFSSAHKKQQEHVKFETSSPQKYGKGGYAELTFTPSKLADNILYKEVSNQKRLEQQSRKLRQTEATSRIFEDRLHQLIEQKEGIQKSLNQQIIMYKKMLGQREQKNKMRIRQIQDGFNKQMQRILDQREQQTRYVQSQKQQYQRVIQQLQETILDLRAQLQNVHGNHDQQRNQNQKLRLIQESLTKRNQDLQTVLRKTQQKAKQQIDALRKQLDASQLEWQRKLSKQIQERNRQVQNMQRLHRNELQKTQNKRVQQALIKNQELKDLVATFEKQTSRLNSIIEKKQELIDQLNRAIQLERQKSFTAAKSYENQINSLSHEKSRFKQQLLKADRKVQKLSGDVHQLEQKLRNQSSNLQEEIIKLKKDLELNQISFMRQVDKNDYEKEDLSRELVRLKVQNDQVLSLTDENTSLHRELRNMKQLLIESSLQMERCKQQFIRIGREKDLLVIKLRQVGMQNQTLYRIKNQRQIEARGWRDSYLIQKNQY